MSDTLKLWPSKPAGLSMLNLLCILSGFRLTLVHQTVVLPVDAAQLCGLIGRHEPQLRLLHGVLFQLVDFILHVNLPFLDLRTPSSV